MIIQAILLVAISFCFYMAGRRSASKRYQVTYLHVLPNGKKQTISFLTKEPQWPLSDDPELCTPRGTPHPTHKLIYLKATSKKHLINQLKIKSK